MAEITILIFVTGRKAERKVQDMVSGKYNIILRTPMGAKKGILLLTEEEGILSGSITVKDRVNSFENGSINGCGFMFSGLLDSSVGKMEYKCTGSVDGDKLSATAVAKHGTITITGNRI